MKVTSAAFGALALASIDPRALLAAAAGDHAVLYSWVQYTGADYEGCAQTDGANAQTKAPGCHWTAEVRAIVDDPEGDLTECPGGILKVNGEYADMEVRVMAEANFANMACSYALPLYASQGGVRSISIRSSGSWRPLPVPKWDNDKIAVVGDTGCRLGASHGGLYQSCNNPSLWPAAQVLKSAADAGPDLIFHMGDYIYREGPCATYLNNEGEEGEIGGCKESPYYYTGNKADTAPPNVAENFAVWQADWFDVAEDSVNKAAPLVLIRGNHETCNSRAGKGYYRYLHHGPETDCKTSPGVGTEEWMIDLKDFQVGIMDTSSPPRFDQTTGTEANPVTNQMFADQLDRLGNYFTKPALMGTHYPILGWGASDDDIAGGDGSIQIYYGMQAAANRTKTRRVPDSFDLLLGSHIHLGQVTTFEDSKTGEMNVPQLVVGNSGTQFVAPTKPIPVLGNETLGLPEYTVKDTGAMYQYGYVLVTKTKSGRGRSKAGKGNKKSKAGKGTRYLRNGGDPWELDFKDQVGRTMLECKLYLKDIECEGMVQAGNINEEFEETDGDM